MTLVLCIVLVLGWSGVLWVMIPHGQPAPIDPEWDDEQDWCA